MPGANEPANALARGLGKTCRHEWRHGTQECVRHVGGFGIEEITGAVFGAANDFRRARASETEGTREAKIEWQSLIFARTPFPLVHIQEGVEVEDRQRKLRKRPIGEEVYREFEFLWAGLAARSQ